MFVGIIVALVVVAGCVELVLGPTQQSLMASVFNLQSITPTSRTLSGTLTLPTPALNACQNAGAGHITAPVSGATYTAGSYLPIAWNITSPSAPTQVTITLVPANGGSQILFARYSSATNVTTNGTITATTTRGGDSAGVIPGAIPAGQYYVQIALTVNGATGISCSPTFMVVAPPVCTHPTSGFGYVSTLTTSGTNGLVRSPLGIAVDASGNVYVIDRPNNRIKKFSASGAYLTQWPALAPYGIMVDQSGNVYVGEQSGFAGGGVEKFTSNGSHIASWQLGSGSNQQANGPWVALDSSGNVYATDTQNHMVDKFTSSGTLITRWGGIGSGNGQLSQPQGIAVSSSGNVYVVDTNNNRIEEFTSAGGYLAQWGTVGSGNGQLMSPLGIAIDGSGNVYVSDWGNNRVEEFTSTGSYIKQWGTVGSGNNQFNYPEGIAVDHLGNIYVSDWANSRVQKFGFTECVQS